MNQNAETIYASISGIIALFGTVWYLLWKHKAVDKFEHDFFQSIRDWWALACEMQRADWQRSKRIVRTWLKTLRRN